MTYFYLKIGTGNSEAGEWLAGRNPLRRPAAVIYFDNYSLKEYKAGKGGDEPRNFWKHGKPKFRHQTRMVVVHDGEVWILEPIGTVRFLPSKLIKEGEARRHTPKAMPVKVLVRRAAKDVPPVLAGITANQFLTRGTFRQIKDWGNLKAIDFVVGGRLEGEHWQLDQNGPEQLLECLGSTELETLVAKLLEAHKCFVPAYRGGLMKDIDLFAYNDSSEPICVGKILVPPKKRVSLQIKRRFKRRSRGMTTSRAVDYLIGLNAQGRNSFDAEWLLKRVQECRPVAAWLKRSLKWWLPASLLEKFELV